MTVRTGKSRLPGPSLRHSLGGSRFECVCPSLQRWPTTRAGCSAGPTSAMFCRRRCRRVIPIPESRSAYRLPLMDVYPGFSVQGVQRYNTILLDHGNDIDDLPPVLGPVQALEMPATLCRTRCNRSWNENPLSRSWRPIERPCFRCHGVSNLKQSRTRPPRRSVQATDSSAVSHPPQSAPRPLPEPTIRMTEGWHCLHLYYRVDQKELNRLDEAARARGREPSLRGCSIRSVRERPSGCRRRSSPGTRPISV